MTPAHVLEQTVKQLNKVLRSQGVRYVILGQPLRRYILKVFSDIGRYRCGWRAESRRSSAREI